MGRLVAMVLVVGLFGLMLGLAIGPERASAEDRKRQGCKEPGICSKGLEVCGTDKFIGDGHWGCQKHCCVEPGGTCNKFPTAGGGNHGRCCGPDETFDKDTHNCRVCPAALKCGSECCGSSQTCVRQGFPDERCETTCANETDPHKSQIYDPATQCCAQYGIEQKYPIQTLARCEKTMVARKGYQGTPNGCGPEGKPVPSTYEGGGRTASLAEACDKHDACYDTCKADKTRCDKAFAKQMKAACKATFKGRAYKAHLKGCNEMAAEYSDATTTYGRLGPWQDAQAKACQCCP